ncbi:hypothetical protein Zmor_017630 [Zophobas morio]|uniref:Dehydrogenase/reductase SDR family member 11 n=1 Tax=Zophobas morio TaxID=2755281 RepID=A0AA38I9X2_9CUCU|nr:hypothetical protein Zmor_017630 [Zophobas morio]
MVLSMDRWKGKVAIVTGASAGIGEAITDALVEEGVIVVGVARNIETLEAKSKTLTGKKGKLHPIKGDFSREGDILKVFEWTSKNLGPVHILINNAAASNQTTLMDGKTEDWKSVFDLNVIGLCIATREAVKIMKENKINGHIIHINSVLGHQVVNVPRINVYPASKFAVTALTETLRQELNHLGLKIKISDVSPGFVATRRTTFAKDLTPERKAFYENKPAVNSEDIADGVIYALSTPEHVQVHELMIRPFGP